MTGFKAIGQGRAARARLRCDRPIAGLGIEAARRFRHSLWTEQLPALVLDRLAIMTANRGIFNQLELLAEGFV